MNHNTNLITTKYTLFRLIPIIYKISITYDYDRKEMFKDIFGEMLFILTSPCRLHNPDHTLFDKNPKINLKEKMLSSPFDLVYLIS